MATATEANIKTVVETLNKQIANWGVLYVKIHNYHWFVKGKNFFTLHAALWNGGVFLYVPKNVEVKIPLQAIFIADDAEATFAPHILIVAESNSSVVYVDNYISEDGKEFVHNGIVEVIAKPGSSVQFASVHDLGKGSTGVTYRRAIAENDARIEWIIGELNSGNAMLPHQAMEVLYAGADSLYEKCKVEHFRDRVAIYPLGATVTLNTGETGVVVDVNSQFAQRPIVRILEDQDGQTLKEPYEVDLSTHLSVIVTGIGNVQVEEPIKFT